jgi:hypothetical protein
LTCRSGTANKILEAKEQEREKLKQDETEKAKSQEERPTKRARRSVIYSSLLKLITQDHDQIIYEFEDIKIRIGLIFRF